MSQSTPLRRPWPRQPLLPWRWTVLGLCLAAVCFCGCVYHRVVKDGWAPLRALSSTRSAQTPKATTANPAVPAPEQWSILIAEYPQGSAGKRQASTLLDQLHHQAHLPDLWIQDASEQTRVYRGLYDRPDAQSAASDLRQTRLVRLESGRSLESVRLVPLGSASEPIATHALDLRQHRGKFSLQIGYYDEQFGNSFRQATEEAADALRAQGHEAYFYHGPHRSMVTIGLFSDADFVQEGAHQTYGPRIRALQQEFPFNLANGRTMIEKINGQSKREAPSFLVRVH